MDDLPSAQGPPLFQSIPTPEKEQVQLRKKLRVGSPGPIVPPPVFDPPPLPRMQGEMPPPDRPSSRGNLVDPEMLRRRAARKRELLEERDRLLKENPPGPPITGFFRPRTVGSGKRKTKRKMKRKNKKSRKHKK
jgi:hypothetical protein